MSRPLETHKIEIETKDGVATDGHATDGPPWPFGQEQIDGWCWLTTTKVASNARISLFACENSNKMVFTLSVWVFTCSQHRHCRRRGRPMCLTKNVLPFFVCSFAFSHVSKFEKPAAAARCTYSAAFMFRLTQIIRTYLCSGANECVCACVLWALRATKTNDNRPWNINCHLYSVQLDALERTVSGNRRRLYRIAFVCVNI